MVSNKKLVLLAIHPTHYKNTLPIVAQLRREGAEVIHPQTVKDFKEICDSVSTQDIIITLYYTKDTLFREKLRGLEHRCLLVDSFYKMQLTENRRKTLQLLSYFDIKTPGFFFGSPSKIPISLGNVLVSKHPFGQVIKLVKREGMLRSDQKRAYVEERIPNDKKIVRCVTHVFGKIFTRIKQDRFSVNISKNSGTEPVIHTSEEDTRLAKKVQKIIGMKLFNLDLIDDVVIEVNCCPNFFLYKSVVGHFVSQVEMVGTHFFGHPVYTLTDR